MVYSKGSNNSEFPILNVFFFFITTTKIVITTVLVPVNTSSNGLVLWKYAQCPCAPPGSTSSTSLRTITCVYLLGSTTVASLFIWPPLSDLFRLVRLKSPLENHLCMTRFACFRTPMLVHGFCILERCNTSE